MLCASVWILLYLPLRLAAFADDYPVIETHSPPEIVVHVVDPANPVKKLKCGENKTVPGVAEIAWQFKQCGFGLNLTACANLPENTPWTPALCRNQTKFCTGLTLPIYNPTAADSGLYRCLQKNYMMPKYHINRAIQLDVRDFRSKSIEIVPEMDHLDNQTVYENQTAVLRCRIRSTVHPFMAWMRFQENPTSNMTFVINGVPHQFLNGSVVHVGSNYLYTSKLYITQTRTEDAGAYFCLAIGDRENVTKEVHLNVVPLVSNFEDFSISDYGMAWFAVAMCFSVLIILVVISLVAFRKRPKAFMVPTDDLSPDC